MGSPLCPVLYMQTFIFVFSCFYILAFFLKHRLKKKNLWRSDTHSDKRAFLSCFNFNKRTLPIARICCPQRARPLIVCLGSLSEERYCSISTSLSVSPDLSAGTSPKLALSAKHTKEEIHNIPLQMYFMELTVGIRFTKKVSIFCVTEGFMWCYWLLP